MKVRLHWQWRWTLCVALAVMGWALSAAADELPIDSINRLIRKAWTEHRVAPSSAATDGEWCRRLYLDLVGRIPRVDELAKFLNDPARDRKARLVDRLLGPAYTQDYAQYWTTIWTNLLIGRTGGTERRTLTNREGLRLALAEAFASNLPYDRLASNLISARGASKPGQPGFNGFVNYLAGKLGENGVQATAKTAQIFLGQQVQCTQCHSHPFNEWKQSQFWELNAFFRQTRALRRFEGGTDVAWIELVNEDFPGEDNRPLEAAVFFEMRNGLTKVAYPVFVDGTRLKSNSGLVSDVDRRTELARLIVGSEALPRALVNRMWAHFLGYGFTQPVDDMGPHNLPSHPELLETLADHFKIHGYDLKQLIRWIVLSEPYGLSSRIVTRNRADDPAGGTPPLFSHFYLRQMRAEELYESLLTATEAHNTEGNSDIRAAARQRWLEQFTRAFGTDDEAETTTFNGTIPQTLMMMNGELVVKATSGEPGSLLARLAGDSSLSNAQRINHLYQAGLSRLPTPQEVSAANQIMQLRGGDAIGALQDVWWAVLNSNEFILNH